MGTAEIPNVALVITFTVIALLAGVLVLEFASASTSFIVVPKASTITGIAVFSTSMVITSLADLPLWLSVLIALIVGALVGVWSATRWHDHNSLLRMAHERLKKKEEEKGDQSAPAGETAPTVET